MNINFKNSRSIAPAVNFKAMPVHPALDKNYRDEYQDGNHQSVKTSASILGATALFLAGVMYFTAKKQPSKVVPSIQQNEKITSSLPVPLKKEAIKLKENVYKVFVEIKSNIFEYITDLGNKIRLYADKKGEQLIIKRGIDGKVLKKTRIYKNGSYSAEFLEKGMITTKKNKSGSVIKKLIGNNGYKTTVMISPDGYTYTQITRGKELIGSVAHKNGQILKETGSIKSRFDENKNLTFEVLR